ncbi:MAG: type II toxin-antitoxin system Phd/YefM family antitoxin [Acidimicrobiales bacterium]
MVNIHEAKTQLSKLVARVAAGEEIVIAKAGVPIARLVPYAPEPQQERRPGSMSGRIWMADDWDSDETNAEIARGFYEEESEDEVARTKGGDR